LRFSPKEVFDLGYVKEVIDKILKIQNRFYPETKEYYSMGEGRVSLLRVVGVDGETVLLRCNKGRIEYAQGDETPVHIFRCSSDTFLSVLSGDEDLREAVTKGHFLIESASTGSIDLVEAEKWSKAFDRLKGLIRKYVGL